MDMPMPAANNHGFSLLGQKSLVLSHIPMFMPPHQAQVFLEAKLSGGGGEDPTEIYLKDMQRSGNTNYVLVSDKIILQNLSPRAHEPIRSFTGTLYKGWPFNNPNTAPLLAEGVTVEITRALYFEKIAVGDPLPDLTYLAFQTSETGYFVHKLVQPHELEAARKPPGFVQILSGHSKPEHLHGVQLLTIPGVADNFAARLQAHKTVQGRSSSAVFAVTTDAELIYDPDHLTM